ncbi:cobalt-precorrin-6A reductase [Micromonospora sp. WMMD718]|uniref:Cobalt-precorrin-6A reductase n=2 Tax=Micromonospora TaxID=1873 RepID=A0A3M9K9T2_9ACTN|nr:MULTISPECIES: cobalt-precorrin-6A reductase [unclassified Micromonospora]AXH93504.1 cobalt-precorrin-6A reductase [Micromonospora aurantiaca]EWM65028.1 precorrin-6x reductase [Micromonospora sp. M42]ODB78245.1 precorrin-6A reductase [Micromonospora sp. II]OHX07048.1 precorrin-6A reductase [Micromonospora sp. WMMB235]OKJ46081.1 cobalt-precorrin-6X reductase [Micromonospora sp. TSRI0369]RQW87562.1 cobalt-precorrin-6A reductase [Micromonospora chalcea]
MRILVLGGTGEARALAASLVDDGAVVVTSLAGRVARPRLPVGQVRVGGFGGIAGLAAYLAETRVRAVVDATHPFAEKISANAAAACPAAGVPLLRLERPGWAARPEASAWYWAGDHSEAARVAAGLGDRPFLTVGRQSLAHFVEPLRRHACLVRVVDEPDIVLPVSWKLLRSRGPYTLAHEREVMAGTDVLVTKDSGGDHTVAKLEVAAERAMPVVIVRRAGPPAGVPLVRDVDAALAWVRALPAP